MNQLIVQAIREKRLIGLTYNGRPRIVEPHTYYRTVGGHEMLECYQVHGGHGSTKRVAGDEWEYFSVVEITNLSLLEKTFSGPRPDYKKPLKTSHVIYAQL